MTQKAEGTGVPLPLDALNISLMHICSGNIAMSWGFCSGQVCVRIQVLQEPLFTKTHIIWP